MYCFFNMDCLHTYTYSKPKKNNNQSCFTEDFTTLTVLEMELSPAIINTSFSISLLSLHFHYLKLGTGAHTRIRSMHSTHRNLAYCISKHNFIQGHTLIPPR